MTQGGGGIRGGGKNLSASTLGGAKFEYKHFEGGAKFECNAKKKECLNLKFSPLRGNNSTTSSVVVHQFPC